MIIEKKMRIIPDKAMFDSEICEMVEVDKSLWLDGFAVHLDKNKNIEKLVVYGSHPNADPETGVLCLSDEVIGKSIESIGIPMLFSFVSTHNLTTCYFRPWGKFRLKKGKL